MESKLNAVLKNYHLCVRLELHEISSTMQIITLIFAAVGVTLFVHIAESKAVFDYACDPRSSEVSCLLGCLGCFEYYGGHMYNMAACCQECKDTQEPLIDDGPVKCSQRFIKGSWMRRFGKWATSLYSKFYLFVQYSWWYSFIQDICMTKGTRNIYPTYMYIKAYHWLYKSVCDK